MRKNLFEIGSKFSDDGWSSDNKVKTKIKSNYDIKTPQKHNLTFAREKRRGKIVIIVKPFCLSKDDLKFLLKSLKKELGIGGTLRDDTLEFQGEVENKLRISLVKREFRLR